MDLASSSILSVSFSTLLSTSVLSVILVVTMASSSSALVFLVFSVLITAFSVSMVVS